MLLTRPQTIGVQAGALDRMSQAEGMTAAALHERYARDVFQYVVRRVPRREEAEDITAEVFAAAFVGLPRHPSLAALGWVPGGQSPPYLWLLGIARRQIAIALRRKAARRETLASELASGTPEADPLLGALAAVEGPEAALVRAGYPRHAERRRGGRRVPRRVLRELLDQLGADQREALMLQQVERLSVAEIALVMRRSPASIYSLLKRARAALYRRGRAYFLDDDEEQRA